MTQNKDNMILYEDDENDQDCLDGIYSKNTGFSKRTKGIPTKALYKLFLKEYNQHCHAIGPPGCMKCDERVRAVQQANVNSIRLRSLISWQPFPNKEHGIFTYAREHLKHIRSLQNGETMCKKRMIKLATKLKSLPASKNFLNLMFFLISVRQTALY